MKIIVVGIIIGVVLITVICWAVCIFATDIEKWEREVHEFEDETGDENRSRNK